MGVGQVELGRQFHAVLNAQVFLPFEALLERLQLMVGESRPGFPLFLAQVRTGIPAVVVSVTCANKTKNKNEHPKIFRNVRRKNDTASFYLGIQRLKCRISDSSIIITCYKRKKKHLPGYGIFFSLLYRHGQVRLVYCKNAFKYLLYMVTNRI